MILIIRLIYFKTKESLYCKDHPYLTFKKKQNIIPNIKQYFFPDKNEQFQAFLPIEEAFENFLETIRFKTYQDF